jgi:hypothetical protein
MYFVLGIEPFNYAEVRGTHMNKKIAEEQAEQLEKNKPYFCCQRYKCLTQTDIKKQKLNLFI